MSLKESRTCVLTVTRANNKLHQQDPVGVWVASSPQSIPLLHPRMTMVIHWKLTKKIEYSFRFAWTPADHEECDDGYEDYFD